MHGLYTEGLGFNGHRRLHMSSSAPGSFKDTSAATRGIVSGLTALVNAGTPEAPPIVRTKEKLAPKEVLQGIREDIEEREYLWSGKITDELYDEDCVFTDPTLSFEGLSTFKRNLANLDPLLERFVPPSQRRVAPQNRRMRETLMPAS